MNCPGCQCAEMVTEHFPGHYGAAIVVEVCHACSGLWFDGRESLQLTPGATLQLFRSMHEEQPGSRAPLVTEKHCPRCAEPLRESHDRVRATRFSYFECLTHGRYITFFQWLREKELVRAPTENELRELKQHFNVVNCSNCGAPIELLHQSTCSHCTAPVNVIDRDAMAAAVDRLQQKEIERTTVNPGQAISAILMGIHANELKRTQRRVDLVTEGLEFIFRLLL